MRDLIVIPASAGSKEIKYKSFVNEEVAFPIKCSKISSWDMYTPFDLAIVECMLFFLKILKILITFPMKIDRKSFLTSKKGYEKYGNTFI